jgi:tetratricopeptide (TPR) repeat protein
MIERADIATPATRFADRMAAAYGAGEMTQVIDLAAQAAAVGTADEAVLFWLGLAQQAGQLHAEASTTFGRLTELRPGISAYWNNLGVACRLAGDAAASETAFQTAKSLAPDDPEVHYNLGLLYIQEKRWLPAREALLDAVERAPPFIEARLQAAHACYVCGDNSGQQAMLAGAIDWPPQPAEQALLLATMLSVQGELPAALQVLARAELPPEPAATSMRLRIAAQQVALYERGNQLAQARDALRQLPLDALERLPPSEHRARVEGWSAHAAMVMRAGEHAAAAELYRRVLALAVDHESQASAGFGLAAACDKLGRHAEAWQAAQTAHAAQLDIARNIVPAWLAPDSQPLEMARRSIDRHAYAGWTALASPSGEQSPVFVLGFPRSGTTLLEQMLDAHPDFQSMDERAFIHELTERMQLAGQRYPDDLARLTQRETDQLRAVYFKLVDNVLPGLGQRRLVDKNPLNMLCLPMIMRLFPQARIILCLRHPCDVLLSCSMQPFRSPAFMVLCSSLQRLAQGYVQAFEQWERQVEVFAPRVLEWRYEAVTGHFEEHVARLGQFLELDDAAPMARFAEHAQRKGFISTPSYAEVTRGIHARAVDRWRAYAEYFEPVLPVLRPLLDRFGYSA